MITSQTRRQITQQLRAAGVDTPELDSRCLIDHVTGVAYPGWPQLLTKAEQAALETLVAQRISGMPIARLRGHKEFWSLNFALNSETLVPRPETETVIETALALYKDIPPRRILDLGTGSGCLLLALLSEFPKAWGVGVDINLDAAAQAQKNAEALGYGNRAAFCVANWSEAINCKRSHIEATGFDLIVSNPPYIETESCERLASEVKADPRRALDGGEDGLDAYRLICAQSPLQLAPNGRLIFEIGAGQAQAVRSIAEMSGLSWLRSDSDLGGHVRSLAFQRHTD